MFVEHFFRDKIFSYLTIESNYV